MGENISGKAIKQRPFCIATNLKHSFSVCFSGKEECSVTRESTVTVNLVAEACTQSVQTGQVVNMKAFASKFC